MGTALASVAAASACLATTAHARPGDLDPSFSRNGLVRTSFGESSEANAVGIGPGGKIVVVGASDRKLAIARYRPGGRLDRTFSQNGRLRMPFGGYTGGYGLAIQPDGRILVLGSSAQRGVFLGRFTPRGVLDPSFSGDGLLTGIGDAGNFADLALDGDGRIVLAGSRSSPELTCMAAAARFEPDGTPDATFSGDGVATVGFPGYDCGWGTSVAVEPDGSPVLAGQVLYDDFLTTDLALARFEPDGEPDPSFSGDGTTTLDIGPVDDTDPGGVAIRSDGRIVAAGDSCSSPEDLYGSCSGEIARFNPDGSLDNSFGNGGFLTHSLRRGPYVGSAADALALTDDGGAVLAGGTLTDRQGYGPVDFALVRLDAAGTTDASFRGGGMWATDFLSDYDDAYDVVVQQDGKIVAVGKSNRRTARGFSRQMALARYEVADGPRDADADGVRDAADRCPTRFGGGRQGCRHYERSLTMERRKRKDLFLGELRSSEPGCIDDQRIRVLRARRGRDFEVDATRTDGGGGWEVDARLHPGRYYAVAPPSHGRRYGRCLEARADGFRI